MYCAHIKQDLVQAMSRDSYSTTAPQKILNGIAVTVASLASGPKECRLCLPAEQEWTKSERKLCLEYLESQQDSVVLLIDRLNT